ncbi:hypothetical protein ON010_g4359 [Phytophthora cinnamomi]|nr:hypothetical protein ON010_g4359 [Phytophthora cinnamomi]
MAITTAAPAAAAGSQSSAQTAVQVPAAVSAARASAVAARSGAAQVAAAVRPGAVVAAAWNAHRGFGCPAFNAVRSFGGGLRNGDQSLRAGDVRGQLMRNSSRAEVWIFSAMRRSQASVTCATETLYNRTRVLSLGNASSVLVFGLAAFTLGHNSRRGAGGDRGAGGLAARRQDSRTPHGPADTNHRHHEHRKPQHAKRISERHERQLDRHDAPLRERCDIG